MVAYDDDAMGRREEKCKRRTGAKAVSDTHAIEVTHAHECYSGRQTRVLEHCSSFQRAMRVGFARCAPGVSRTNRTRMHTP